MSIVIGINGSPRKKNNSAIMLEHALEGARAAGAKTELVHLVDLNYTGCMSCFACKRLGGESFGKCALKDDMTEVLEKVLSADGLIISTPIYYGDVTGMVRNFYERLLFPGNLYKHDFSVSYEKRVRTGIIYTMNCPNPEYFDYLKRMDQGNFSKFIGECEVLCAAMTWQFDDYSKYTGDIHDVENRWKHHVEVFPKDCEKAYEMGMRVAGKN